MSQVKSQTYQFRSRKVGDIWTPWIDCTQDVFTSLRERPRVGNFEYDTRQISEQPRISKKLDDTDIDTIISQMPDGLDGFLKTWGLRQFAYAVESYAENFGTHGDEHV